MLPRGSTMMKREITALMRFGSRCKKISYII